VGIIQTYNAGITRLSADVIRTRSVKAGGGLPSPHPSRMKANKLGGQQSAQESRCGQQSVQESKHGQQSTQESNRRSRRRSVVEPVEATADIGPHSVSQSRRWLLSLPKHGLPSSHPSRMKVNKLGGQQPAQKSTRANSNPHKKAPANSNQHTKTGVAGTRASSPHPLPHESD
jgi:hypothetical protein